MARTSSYTGLSINNDATYTTAALDAKNSYFVHATAKGTAAAALAGNPVMNIHVLFSADGTNYTDIIDSPEQSSIRGKVGFKTGATAVHGLSGPMLIPSRPNTSGTYVKFVFENKTGQNLTSLDVILTFNVELA